MYPVRTPSSMRTLRWVGTPSSSIRSVPQAPSMVPSSTAVTSGEATSWPIWPGEDRGALGDVVGLEAVAARLVEEDTAELVADHHRHRPGGGGLGVEEQGGAARRLEGGVTEHRRVEELETGRPTGGLVAALDLAAARGDRLDEGADPGAAVAGEGAVAVGDDDRLDALGVGRGDLPDRAALLTGGGVGAAEQVDLAGHVDGVGGTATRCSPTVRSRRSIAAPSAPPRAATAAVSAARWRLSSVSSSV